MMPDELHLVASELPIEEPYYPLLFMATPRKRRQFLEELARRGNARYFEEARLIYPQEVEEVEKVIPMRKAFPDIEENMRYILTRMKEKVGDEELKRLMTDVLGRDAIIRLAEELASQKDPNGQPPKPKRRTRKKGDS
jgi:hypothetical protein